MSVVATVAVPTTTFPLETLVRNHPETTVRLVQVIPDETSFVPYFWVENGGVATIDSALRDGEHSDSFEIVYVAGPNTLVRVEWSEAANGFIDLVYSTGGTVFEGVGALDSWRFQLRFDERADLSTFYRECGNRNITVDVLGIHTSGVSDGSEPGLGPGVELTDIQRETLLTALEVGYFDVPRETNLTDLAAKLGVSDTATSQRLRRGIAALLEQTLAAESNEG